MKIPIRGSSVVAGMGAALIAFSVVAQERTLSDDELRSSAPSALELSDVPDMSHILDEFIADEAMAIALGKAFFWDKAVGSGGVACASCHFNAGADTRSVNALSPGLNAGDQNFDTTLTGGGGPNYRLDPNDFGEMGVPKDFNDVVSSQGAHHRLFQDYQEPPFDRDICTVQPSLFNVNGIIVRRVEPRNTPTVVNAVFNHRNFWDGRASNIFNGVTPLGVRSNVNDPNLGVWRVDSGTVATKHQIEVHNASLASQAVGPVLSDFEMSCAGRLFPQVGAKMLPRRALSDQYVANDDSAFSSVGSHGSLVDASGKGLTLDYAAMIQTAFKEPWWSGTGTYDGDYSHMEANFSLYWGLAIQMYEATLVSNQTPFDDFARGNNDALTDEQKLGLEIFLNQGKCINCHSGPEFTGAAVRFRARQPDGNNEAMERMVMGNNQEAVYDGGFYNIGVRGTAEDLCIGADLDGFPLSLSRQAATGNIVDSQANDVITGGSSPNGGAVELGERVAVDGACKTPTIRNVALTAPYFHNGGASTLSQVVRMYDDGFQSLFANENSDNLDPDIGPIGLSDDEMAAVVAFMAALTDERVRLHQAPFDHPHLPVSNGAFYDHTWVADWNGDNLAEGDGMVIPVVGAGGYAAPLDSFLGIDQSIATDDAVCNAPNWWVSWWGPWNSAWGCY